MNKELLPAGFADLFSPRPAKLFHFTLVWNNMSTRDAFNGASVSDLQFHGGCRGEGEIML